MTSAPPASINSAARSGARWMLVVASSLTPGRLSVPFRPLAHQPKEPLPMPEAVIVDAVRSPIGRAFKGSLAQLRPDETAAYVVDQLLERNPDVDPALVEDVFCGCGMPQGLQAFNIARIIVLL